MCNQIPPAEHQAGRRWEMKLICNRDGCTEPATHQGYIGNPPVIVALCKVHAIENAIKRQQEGAAEPAPEQPHYLQCKECKSVIRIPIIPEHDATIASAAIQQEREKAKIGQCENCWSNGRRECMYHGYPQDTIPRFCGYKLDMDLPAPKDRRDITVGMVYAYEAGLKEADDKVQKDRTRIRNAVSALSTGDFTVLDVLAIIEGEK